MKKIYLLLICVLLFLFTGISVYAQTPSHTLNIEDKNNVLSSYAGTGKYMSGKMASVKFTETAGKSVKNWIERINGSYVSLGADFDIAKIKMTNNRTFIPNSNFQISLDVNGGSGIENTNITYDFMTPTFTLPLPYKEGHTFNGWTGSNGATPQKNVSIEQYTGGDRNYKANWTKDVVPTTHTVSFYDWNIDENVIEQTSFQTIPHSEFAVPPTPDPHIEGYDFLGWYTTNTCIIITDPAQTPPESNLFDFNTHIESDIKLCSGWKIKSYTVSFNNMGVGTAPKAFTNVPHGAQIEMISPPEATGYTFKGWFKDSELSKPFNFSTEYITDNITLYAKWESATHTVHLDNMGVGDLLGELKVGHNAILTTLSAPTAKGYKFGGWYKDPSFTTEFTFPSDPIKNDITVYVKWIPITYTIRYSSNSTACVEVHNCHTPNPPEMVNPCSGTMSDSVHTYGESKKLNKLNYKMKDVVTDYYYHPTSGADIYYPDGWTVWRAPEFIGWATNPDGTGTVYYDEESVLNLAYTDGAVITLYAIWEPTVTTQAEI